VLLTAHGLDVCIVNHEEHIHARTHRERERERKRETEKNKNVYELVLGQLEKQQSKIRTQLDML